LREVIGGVVINEVEAEPLSDYVLDFIIAQKKECPYLDFKYTIHVGKNSDFPEIAKDIFAFSNYGGGWILIGWKEETKNQYLPVGLPEDYEVDQAVLQEKFNSYSNLPITIEYREFSKNIDGVITRLAAVYMPPSYEILKPTKIGKYIKRDKERIVFKEGEIFYRRGTQSIPPSSIEMEIIRKRLRQENYRISVLSGEPDKVDEKIYSNLFPIKKFPKYIYSGSQKDYDRESMIVLLNQEGVFPYFYFKFKEWNNRIVTFENFV
jgi:predicted HTH transcriptional regulator